jgi:hypothetical protein
MKYEFIRFILMLLKLHFFYFTKITEILLIRGQPIFLFLKPKN